MLTITTPYGNRYIIHDNGNIERTDIPGFEPSGQWKLLGIKPCYGNDGFIPLAQITTGWLAANPLTYKNGNPRYTGVDVDHGTRREWGNTKHHGIKTITITVGPKHVGTWVLVVEGGELTKFGKDSDTKFPYPPDDKDALKEAKYQATEGDSTIYILHVFDNGQMKQFEYEEAEEGVTA